MTKNKTLKWTGIGLLSGLAIGMVSGAVAHRYYQEKKHIDPELILQQVKEAFLEQGDIEGSWIEFNTYPLEKVAVTYDTYTGGITRCEKGELVQYEFIADANTGVVLDLYRI